MSTLNITSITPAQDEILTEPAFYYRSVKAEIVRDLGGEPLMVSPQNLNPASELLDDLVLADDFVSFLTLPAYEQISRL